MAIIAALGDLAGAYALPALFVLVRAAFPVPPDTPALCVIWHGLGLRPDNMTCVCLAIHCCKHRAKYEQVVFSCQVTQAASRIQNAKQSRDFGHFLLGWSTKLLKNILEVGAGVRTSVVLVCSIWWARGCRGGSGGSAMCSYPSLWRSRLWESSPQSESSSWSTKATMHDCILGDLIK